jgi:hypothetical protein
MKNSIIGARALLFVALSGAAVPACQHYDAGGGKSDREQADLRLSVPSLDERALRVELTCPPKPEWRRWKLDA